MDHLFVVSEAGGHGMQVLDLTQLEALPDDQVTVLEETAWYTGFGNSHTVSINTETGYAYALGTNTFGGSLHIIDISNPANPVLAGSFEGDYSHDAQPVVYHGPDVDYAGHELVFCYNGYSGFAIVDAQDKQDVQLISEYVYPELGYTHQGWVTPDHRYCIFDDELDEMNFGGGTRTYVVDIQDLDNPQVVGYYLSESQAIDHNLYVIGDKVYSANYTSGLRILDIVDPASGTMELVGFFDTNPDSDAPVFDGAWSCYPFFPSGMVGISTFSHFFLVRPSDAIAPETANSVAEQVELVAKLEAFPNPASDVIRFEGMHGKGDFRLLDVSGKAIRTLPGIHMQGSFYGDISTLSPGLYVAEWTTAAGRATTRFAVE